MPRRFTGTVPRPQSRRFRVSVPDADESVLAWIGAQSDLSASVRSLIREAIERHGYRDATCYPVQQQPRRGRPPKLTEQAELTVDEIVEAGAQAGETLDFMVEPKPEVPRSPVAHDQRDSDVEHDDHADDDDYASDAMTGDIEDMLGSMR